ncbi:MAG: hypothetical protein AVDCRST_MAG49-3816, partial [uncultured Thermomicrobiales bacterium]
DPSPHRFRPRAGPAGGARLARRRGGAPPIRRGRVPAWPARARPPPRRPLGRPAVPRPRPRGTGPRRPRSGAPHPAREWLGQLPDPGPDRRARADRSLPPRLRPGDRRPRWGRRGGGARGDRPGRTPCHNGRRARQPGVSGLPGPAARATRLARGEV